MKTSIIPLVLLLPYVVYAQQPRRYVMDINKDGDTTYAQVPVSGGTTYWHYVEHMPEPCLDIDSFIKVGLRYPADARAARISGRVVLTFMVNQEGTIEHVRVWKSVYPSMDSEAVRLIRSLPPWKPGWQNGSNIPVTLSWPVDFKL